jgi:two-component system chemotaxis family response regulator WspR
MGARDLQTPQDFTVIVLLVDDQPIIGEAVRRALYGQPDIVFHYCDDPAVALSVAARIHPTVILQDLVMPGIDGITLVRRYREGPLTADTPIIVLSTKDDPKVKSEAFAAGANDYLVKLPDSIELIARLRHHSTTYLYRQQRDEAYRALRESQRQLVEINLELQRLTNVDGLTGLSNRRHANESLDLQWKSAVRERSNFSILMIDVDNFKRYNDTYGHLAGDDVLKQIGTAIRSTFRRPTDVSARFGGEEFMVLLPDTDAEAAGRLADGLCKRVAALEIPHSESPPVNLVTISVGGASTTPQHGESPLTLIAVADKALYEAKRLGKNRVLMADNALPPPIDPLGRGDAPSGGGHKIGHDAENQVVGGVLPATIE